MISFPKNLNLKKQSRKSDKKIRRALKQLCQDTGIEFHCEYGHTATHTSELRSDWKVVFVTNAGLVTGVSREQLLDVFLPYGSIDDVVMVPHKQYSFVMFSCVASAERAVADINGIKTLTNFYNEAVVLYVTCVDKVPEQVYKVGNVPSPPSGVTVLREFISEEQEDQLQNLISWDVCHSDDSDVTGSSLKHRLVRHFGYEFHYGVNNVNKDVPLPDGIPGLCQDIMSPLVTSGRLSFLPDQLTVNRYCPGQGIPPHIDTHSAFTDQIVSLSLGSDVTMDFTHPDGRTCPVVLPRRSVLIMEGEARYQWSHGITPRKCDIVTTTNGLTLRSRLTRISFTFRHVRRNLCDCAFPIQCDRDRGMTIGNEMAKRLETEYVQMVYENIADHFSDTRHKPWPHIERFIDNLPIGSVVVDVGCGNGKYFRSTSGLFQCGFDLSRRLCSICHGRGFQSVTASCLRLPLRSACVDALFCIAVLHHLASEERRSHAVEEVVRVLRPAGRALVYVWAMEQKLGDKTSGYIKKTSQHSESQAQDVPDLPLPVHKNRTQFQQQDMLVPWKLRRGEQGNLESMPSHVCHRYYHVFINQELENLFQLVDGVRVIKSYYDEGNWCVIVEKIQAEK